MRHDTQIKTLTAEDVEKMSAPDKDNCLVVSLYLGIRADRDFLTVANSLFSEAGKRIRSRRNLSQSDKELSGTIFSDMEKKLRTIKLPDRTRSFIMFFDSHNGLRIYKVPVYIPPRLVVERDAYIHPFIKNLQKYPHYCTVFLARDRAKLFRYFWGEVEDETEELRSEVPQRMNAGRASWKGLSENRILKHIDVHIDRHLKKVADKTDTYMRKNKIPHLVIGSRKELIERFKEHLPSAIRQKIVGSYLIRTDQSLKRIQEKSLEVIDRFELEREDEMVDKLMEGSSKKKKGAVLGMEPVLRRLDKYEIHELVIGRKYAQGGYLCPDSHRVYMKRKDGLGCKTSLSAVSDMADELIETALARRIKITHFLHDHDDFDKFGIGAILK